MTDLATFGEAMLRLSPPGQERLETATELEFRAAGAEANVAVAAQRLGVETAWLSKLPDSPLGRRVTAHLGQHGVDPAVTWSDEGRQGTYYIEQAGAPRRTNVVYDRADAAVTTATPDELATDRVQGADAFQVSGITPALSATLAATTETLLADARAAGTTTVFDVNYRGKLWSPEAARETIEGLLPEVDVLVTAARDARTVLDRSGTPREMAASLAEDWSFRTVLVTCGAEGAVAWHRGDHHECDAVAAETRDPVGTGDAFVGGYLARRLQGDAVPSAMAYGAATAALKRTIPGDVATVTPAEVERVLADESRRISR